MSSLLLVLVVAAVTFGSRIAFMWRPVDTARVRDNPFLEVFPVALFVAVATAGLIAPQGSIEVTPALFGGVGGAVGAIIFRRSLLAVILAGLAAYWIARLVL